MLVHVGRRLVLVANAGGAMNTLCEIKDPEEVTELIGRVAADKSGSIARTFGTLFRKEEEKFEPPAEASTAGLSIAESSVAQPDAAEDEQDVGLAREEIRGLMEKVRGMSQRFNST